MARCVFNPEMSFSVSFPLYDRQRPDCPSPHSCQGLGSASASSSTDLPFFPSLRVSELPAIQQLWPQQTFCRLQTGAQLKKRVKTKSLEKVILLFGFLYVWSELKFSYFFTCTFFTAIRVLCSPHFQTLSK